MAFDYTINMNEERISEEITELSYVSNSSYKDDPLYGFYGGDSAFNHSWDETTIEAAAVAGGGWGTYKGDIWMGRTINPFGDYKREVNIYGGSYLDGVVSSFGSSSASASVSIGIKNTANNLYKTEKLWSGSTNRVGVAKPDDKIHAGKLGMLLDPDYKYKLYIKLSIEIDVVGAGEAGADFGSGDGDYNTGVDFTRFSIVGQDLPE